MMSVVITGRWMQRWGRFMGPSPLFPTSLLHLHLRPRHQPQLAVGDDRLVAGEALGDHRELVLGAVDLDGTLLGGVALDDVDRAALLTGLHGRGRDDHSALAHGYGEGDLDVLAGPEAVVFVGEGGPEADG